MALPDPLLAFFLFALGALLASFGGVVAGRLGTGQSFVKGRSACDACAAPLGAASLVPVFSWLLANGRCRACAARISAWYPLCELLLGFLFVAAYARFGASPVLALFLAALFLLYVLVLYDARHTIVPPALSFSLTILAVLFAAAAAPSRHALASTLIIASCIGFAFLAAHLLSRGRAMGLGDAPVAFALSLLAGPFALAGLVFSFWIGGAVGIAMLVAAPPGRRMGIEVAFVPFLAAGYLLAIFTQWNPLPF